MTRPRKPRTHLYGGTRRHRLTGPTHLRGDVAVEAHARRVVRERDRRRNDTDD